METLTLECRFKCGQKFVGAYAANSRWRHETKSCKNRGGFVHGVDHGPMTVTPPALSEAEGLAETPACAEAAPSNEEPLLPQVDFGMFDLGDPFLTSTALCSPEPEWAELTASTSAYSCAPIIMTENDLEALIRRGFSLSSSLSIEAFVDVLSGHFPRLPPEALRGLYRGFCAIHVNHNANDK